MGIQVRQQFSMLRVLGDCNIHELILQAREQIFKTETYLSLEVATVFILQVNTNYN